MNNRIARLESFDDASADWIASLVGLCEALDGAPREAFWRCVVPAMRTRHIARRAEALPLPEPSSAEVASAASIVGDDDFPRAWVAGLQRLADGHEGRPCDRPGCRFGQRD